MNTPTIEELEKHLRIDEYALEDALKVHADHFQKVSDELALSISRRDEAKQKLEEIEAEVDLELRKDAAKLEERVTEKEFESNRKLDRRVKSATIDYLNLKRDAARWSALKESFEQRSYALSKLADLYIANYYGSSEKREHRPQPTLRDFKADRVKTELNTRRRQNV